MKKILVAIDGLKYSESTTAYAVHLARQANAHLVGLFLDDALYHSYKIYELIGNEGVSEETREELNAIDEEARQQAVLNFEQACKDQGLHYTIHHDNNVAIQELLHESIYADLLVIDRKETFTHYEENTPTRFVRDLLSEVQCPVLMVPQQYKPIDKIVLLYDGSPASVYAIRQFNYIFQGIENMPTEVITVNSTPDSSHIPDNRLMKEFLCRHFPALAFTVLNGDAETEIINYLHKQNYNPLIVLGAYSRGMVSRWFRPSMANKLMQQVDAPLFITHR